MMSQDFSQFPEFSNNLNNNGKGQTNPNNPHYVSPVPEPTSYGLLLGAGLATLYFGTSRKTNGLASARKKSLTDGNNNLR